MKASELMIGDWVICWSGEPFKIGIVDPDFLHWNEIQPIPLTPEILEKNGFYWGYTSDEEDMMSTIGVSVEEEGWVWDEGAGSAKIIFPNESDGGIIILSDQNFDRDIKFYFVETIYVHELQHALRLCGIDKTIEL